MVCTATHAHFALLIDLAHEMRSNCVNSLFVRGSTVPESLSKNEERKWARLQLAIPVFIRTQEKGGKDSLEFATAINISPGGAMVVVRRSLPKLATVSVEIPSAPICPADGLKVSAKIMQAKTVWVTHFDDYHLLGLKFVRPLSTDTAALSGRRLRKASSAV